MRKINWNQLNLQTVVSSKSGLLLRAQPLESKQTGITEEAVGLQTWDVIGGCRELLMELNNAGG